MSIIKNFSFLTAAHVIEKIITFILVIILARYLGVKEYGIYGLTLSFVGLFGHIFDGGLNLLLMREMAKDGTDKPQLLGRVLIGKIFIGIIVLAAVILAAAALQYPDNTLFSIIIYSISMFLLTFTGTFRSVFIALGRAEFESLLIVAGRFFLLGGVIIYAAIGIRIPGIMTVHLISCSIVFGLGAFICRKVFFSPSWSVNYGEIKDMLREAFPFAIGAIMGEIFFNIDNIMISKMVGLETVGVYNAAYRLSYSGVLFANTLTLASYPYFSKNWLTDKEKVFKVFGRIFKVFIAVSVSFSLTAAIFSENIIGLVFGVEYGESVPLLRVLVWSLPPLCVMHLTIRTLESIGYQRIVVKTMFISILFNIFLNFLLILVFGAIGASIATVITSILIVVIQMKYLTGKINFPGIKLPVSRIAACLFCLLSILLLLKNFHWIIAALAGMAVYILLLFFMKVFT